MKKNEGMRDRLIRLLIGILALIGGFFWLYGTRQIVAYVIALLALFTGIIGFCGLYPLLKITTIKKSEKKSTFIIGIIVIILLGGIFAFLSNFFSRKFFLEDFAKMNDSYKQLLFNSGKEKREESISYYEKLIPAYTAFKNKYLKYKPYALKEDTQLNNDLQKVDGLFQEIKDGIYNGNLAEIHIKLEGVRTIFQDMFKRNGFSMVAVTLVDFHDIMEVILTAANEKNTQKIIETYPLADEKLKEVENELNDEGIQTIRKNLDIILDMAKNNQLDGLAKQAADLKTSFVKVYLIKG